MERYYDLAFGPSVRDVQAEDGSRDRYARVGAARANPDGLGPKERAFVESVDGFYLATATNDGWPYVQFRGGPPGFLKAIGDTILAFADFRGNRQLVSVGNARKDDRVSLFLMDYATKERLKLFARMRVTAASSDHDLRERLAMPGYAAATYTPGDRRAHAPASRTSRTSRSATHRTRRAAVVVRAVAAASTQKKTGISADLFVRLLRTISTRNRTIRQ